ncbi:uncharacterized protein KGF55_005712 [Candida pseudojiufengensis]|uniref:uncharacterized protein n=1 Tax=Candida pseudojiufengensis TaxID=497109 RepID=UPI0022253BA8|nr:uncharacterized protein KGF55_005712 [Candida pseudojiufengensis]KAI5958714.1 hypothetical protein KGF55_005712 [Candida pseudojiufengensis]
MTRNFSSPLFKQLPKFKQSPIFKRPYATRLAEDSPFDHLPKHTNKKWINWKTTTLFFLLGSYLSYNETLFNLYESMTSIDYDDSIPKNNTIPILKLEYQLKNLPIYQKLNHPKNNHQWYKLSSWENLDRNVLDNQDFKSNTSIKNQDEYKKPELTNQTLNKPGGILIKPVTFHNIDTDEGISIIHAGYRLCGYPFIIHGGIIATLLNETFKRNASLNQSTTSNLKDDFKVENLTINYKNPTFANQFLIIKTKQKPSPENDKRTIVLESIIENSKGKVLVKSEALLHDTGRASKKSLQAAKKSWW